MIAKQREAHEHLLRGIRALIDDGINGDLPPSAVAPAIASFIAERLSDVTEEMREAGRHANAMTPDNALGLEYAPFEPAYLANERPEMKPSLLRGVLVGIAIELAILAVVAYALWRTSP